MVTALLLAAAIHCGSERWDQKTLSDDLAPSVNLIPIETTIEQLAGLAAPDPPVKGNEGRGTPGREEFDTYTIEGTVFLAKLEADSDVHLALRGDTSRMVVEIADPRCAFHCISLDEIRDVRRTIRRLTRWRPLTNAALQPLVGMKLRISGVAFFDRLHGQNGGAPNGIELHPVLKLEVIQ